MAVLFLYFQKRYKLNFITSDGTEEAEMICFGEIGRRIVGKPVETVMRTPKGNDLLPLDVAGILFQIHIYCIND